MVTETHAEQTGQITDDMDNLELDEDDILLSTLRQVFKLKDFRPGQREIIQKIMSGKDGLVLLYTGGGKTLCFTLPAVLSKGITVVVLPTISLMQDLADRLNDVCPYVCISQTFNSNDEKDNIIKTLTQKDTFIKVVLITPESLQDPIIHKVIQQINIERFIIEECHCVDEWGHQFRPSYLTLGNLKDKLKVQFVGFTATATQQTQLSVLTILHLKDAFIHRGTFKRDNLFLDIRPKQTFKQVCQEISDMLSNDLKDKCCIIYCLTKSECINVCNYLIENNFMCVGYHGDLRFEEKSVNLHRWRSEQSSSY